MCHSPPLLGKTYLSILYGERPWDILGGRGGGVLLLDVSIKMEIIVFLQPRVKKKLRENIIITPEKCLIGVDYVHSLIAICENDSWSMFGPGPFAPNTAIETTIRGSFWNLTFLKEGYSTVIIKKLITSKI